MELGELEHHISSLELLCTLLLFLLVGGWSCVLGACGGGGGVPVRPSTGEVGGNSPVSLVMSELLGVKL